LLLLAPAPVAVGVATDSSDQPRCLVAVARTHTWRMSNLHDVPDCFSSGVAAAAAASFCQSKLNLLL